MGVLTLRHFFLPPLCQIHVPRAPLLIMRTTPPQAKGLLLSFSSLDWLAGRSLFFLCVPHRTISVDCAPLLCPEITTFAQTASLLSGGGLRRAS